jgi:hypothetical protein
MNVPRSAFRVRRFAFRVSAWATSGQTAEIRETPQNAERETRSVSSYEVQNDKESVEGNRKYDIDRSVG